MHTLINKITRDFNLSYEYGYTNIELLSPSIWNIQCNSEIKHGPYRHDSGIGGFNHITETSMSNPALEGILCILY